MICGLVLGPHCQFLCHFKTCSQQMRTSAEIHGKIFKFLTNFKSVLQAIMANKTKVCNHCGTEPQKPWDKPCQVVVVSKEIEDEALEASGGEAILILGRRGTRVVQQLSRTRNNRRSRLPMTCIKLCLKLSNALIPKYLTMMPN